MVKFCALLACPNRNCSSSRYVAASSHTLPSHEGAQTKWIEFLKRHNRSLKHKPPMVRTTLRLCSKHFDASCFLKKGLVKDAVPTIAPKFTPEVALKFGLIDAKDSSLFEVLNNFDVSTEAYLMAAAVRSDELRKQAGKENEPDCEENDLEDEDMGNDLDEDPLLLEGLESPGSPVNAGLSQGNKTKTPAKMGASAILWT